MNQSEFFKRELLRLDQLIHIEALRTRARFRLAADDLRGIYVGSDQVDSAMPPEQDAAATLRRSAAMRKSSYRGLDEDAPWASLIREFRLTPEDADALLIALAPELDLKYEALYAFLNNDTTRRFATRDLAFRLLGPYSEDARWRALGPWSTLFAAALLRPADQESGLRRGAFTVNPVLAAFLLGAPGPLEPVTPAGWLQLEIPGEENRCLRDLVPRLRPHVGAERTFVVFEGQAGCSRRRAAAAVCAELGIDAVSLDLRRPGPPLEDFALDNRLRRQALYIAGAVGPEQEFTPEAAALLRLLDGGSSPVFFSVPLASHWQLAMGGRLHYHHRFQTLPVESRRRLWQKEASASNVTAAPAVLAALAERFAFTPGQIRRAAQTLAGAAPPAEACFAAARQQSVHSLVRYARRIKPDRDWGDLILPPGTMRHLIELVGAIEHRHTVQSSWGMRLGEGGINVLFAGTSGTGKSLAAGIIARSLGLDCYQVSIPGIVSKYIGETERNLERLFQAARQSNAILFFDEADALFGKRSEVKDSHDRYANLEVAYLLQKMEEHDGVVMLATNMVGNIDDAFSRRLQFVVEFPPPAEPYRERLWRLMFPTAVPLDDSVDFAFLARQFELTGGQIRSASLDAAFLAAQASGQVTMSLVIRAVARQFAKQHRVPSPAEFQNYFPVLLERGAARQ